MSQKDLFSRVHQYDATVWLFVNVTDANNYHPPKRGKSRLPAIRTVGLPGSTVPS